MAWEFLLLIGAAFGLAYGFVLQKGDFCFVAAFRDLFGFRDTRVLRGLVVAVLVALLGGAILLDLGIMQRGQLWVTGGGFTSLVGGFLFGAAMYYAGSCATGALYRAGMGYAHFWVVLLAMGAGYLLFAALYEPFLFTALEKMTVVKPVTLYEATGLPHLVTALVPVGVLLLWAGRRFGWGSFTRHVRDTLAFFRQSPRALLRARAWDSRAVGLLLGGLVLLQMALWTPLGVTGPETRIAAALGSLVVGEMAVLANPYLGPMFAAYGGVRLGPTEVLVFGMILGAAASAWLGGTWRLRKLRLQRLPGAVLGGLVMGIASRITPGCNIANILAGLPSLSLSSILASAGIVAGVWAVQAFDRWRLELAMREAVMQGRRESM